MNRLSETAFMIGIGAKFYRPSKLGFSKSELLWAADRKRQYLRLIPYPSETFASLGTFHSSKINTSQRSKTLLTAVLERKSPFASSSC